ncbi:glycosyltransferase family 4 protein [Mesorhizobium sp. CGMCC 1.15528]|uniref:Glycosyltransferase family 4 protein n=1 Tax=Mesorhizobium zhangyense TaxID=1776730 RepID=A0A7C9V917_9HYPH|nr:glycosyltransferase family 4 protein [Mesorhizobium zhangyense]NGN41646.1 glycosyltransferase family 4 protein [Mesorhizobium zhangyense]
MNAAPALRLREAVSPRPNCAIHFIPEAYEGDKRLVVGRQSAGAGFLDALVEHGGVDKLYCLTDRPQIYDAFRERVALGERTLPSEWITPFDGDLLEEAGCVFMPGPVISEGAWMRRYIGERRYSVCGITHSVATERVIRSIRDFMVSPTQPWDALICTSLSARQAIEHIFETWGEYLASRGFTVGKTPVQFPIIPLGVHLDRFTRTEARIAAGKELRAKLMLEPDDILVLNFGRLDYRSKSHPVPLFRALEIASRHMRKGRMHLAMVGQFNDPLNEHEFRAARQLFCPSVPVHWIDGADPQTARDSWFAADMFVSLPDNVQESFGLTPVEAMAASLPCIVSDWNGYKETVVDGETGFRIPTIMAPSGAGIELADDHARSVFDHFTLISFTAQCTAVDIDACAEAIARLATDGELRQRMGQTGRKRTEALYDWRSIIAQYQDLWADLGALRRSARTVGGRDPSRQTVHPDYPDLFTMFGGHSSQPLELAMIATVVDPDPEYTLRQMRTLRMNTVARPIMLDDFEIDRIVKRLGEAPESVATLLSGLPEANRARGMRSLMWLCKFGIISLSTLQHDESPPA